MVDRIVLEQDFRRRGRKYTIKEIVTYHRVDGRDVGSSVFDVFVKGFSDKIGSAKTLEEAQQIAKVAIDELSVKFKDRR